MKKIVFVLGAGFTRSFIRHAPLLKDKFSFKPLLRKFNARDFPHAHRILKMEESRQERNAGRFDLERMMTRLDGCMPYDYDNRSLKELDLLYRDVKKGFFDKLKKARALQGNTLPTPLLRFAAECVTNKMSCITFNYDDFLDQALYEARKPFRQWTETTTISDSYGYQWHPLHGYGFFCKPAVSCVSSVGYGASPPSMLLLKLHGSLNWRLKLGAPTPAPLDAIVHFDKWSYNTPPDESSGESFEAIESHLDPLQALILPVLFKSSITQEPVFRLVWTEAYRELLAAHHIYFIGYSLPTTDIAARTLLEESLMSRKKPGITVVNYAADQDLQQRENVRRAYRTVFGRMTDHQFYFDGTLKWLETDFPKVLSSL